MTPRNKKMASPQIIGPMMWHILHTSAANWPLEPTKMEQNEMIHALYGLPALLPCNICKIHLRNYIQSVNVSFEQIVTRRDWLFKFLVDLHNHVNSLTRKPQFSWDQAIARWV